MLLKPSSFHPVESGAFQAEFTTEDGHRINVFINTAGTTLEDEAVAFANDYLAREMQIRQQAAAKIFAENDYVKDELHYASADDLLKVLVPGALTILWQGQETRMAYLSPVDDFERWGEKYVILVSHERTDDKLEMHLEQAPDW